MSEPGENDRLTFFPGSCLKSPQPNQSLDILQWRSGDKALLTPVQGASGRDSLDNDRDHLRKEMSCGSVSPGTRQGAEGTLCLPSGRFYSQTEP